MPDPTTPEGRAELRELIARGSARAVFGWMIGHGPALLDALDDAECEIERQRGDLVIERRRANAAEAAIDSIREYAQFLRWMADDVRQLDAVYQARVYDDIATTLERKIGDRT